jgi:hypothetical protein
LADGRVECEFAKPFETPAIGAEREEESLVKNLSFEAEKENWLPWVVRVSKRGSLGLGFICVGSGSEGTDE